MSNISTLRIPAQISEFAAAFRALSNPHRLNIFLQLATCCRPGTRWSRDAERACVGDLAAGLDLAPSTVSHHIKELTSAGLILTERSGQNVECWVDPKILEGLSKFFTDPKCC